MTKVTLAALVLTSAVVATARPAEAAPDPTIATLLSTGATLLPLTVTAGLFYTGRGTDEGVRLDIGMLTLGLGTIVGPSIGQYYAGGGFDSVLVMLLRGVTSGVMMTGVGLRLRGAEDQRATGDALTVLGAIPTALLILWDIFTAAGTARQTRYRAGHRLQSWVVPSAELLDVARCGPIPCPI